MKDLYLEILKEELVPALGCTEPIAIAFAAARARELLGCLPDRIVAECSGNVIKNAGGVIVPMTKDMRGIETSAILGAVAGNAARELEVLSAVEEKDIETTRALLKDKICRVKLAEGVDNLFIKVTVVCHEAHFNIGCVNCTGDGGRPPGAGLQERASNHLKLLG